MGIFEQIRKTNLQKCKKNNDRSFLLVFKEALLRYEMKTGQNFSVLPMLWDDNGKGSRLWDVICEIRHWKS
jgi:hypothetical protein